MGVIYDVNKLLLETGSVVLMVIIMIEKIIITKAISGMLSRMNQSAYKKRLAAVAGECAKQSTLALLSKRKRVRIKARSVSTQRRLV